MNTTSAKAEFAYLAQGNIRIKKGDAPPHTLESAFGQSIREKAVRAQQKHSWKGGGHDGSPFGGAVLWGKAAMAQDVPLAITSLCGGQAAGSLVYSLESGSLCALLELTPTPIGVEERRLWNDNRTCVRHIALARATGDMVFSLLHQNGTANLGVRLNGESGFKELTEGDSFDTAPRWRMDDPQKIIFQSAGIGRNREGHFLAFGPFSIQQLDPAAGEMTTLVEDPQYDFLAPHCLPDGRLLYIRREYTDREKFDLLRTLKDGVLLPFRLAYAVFQFLNFFSTLFTGRKLTSAGGAKAKEMDMKQMMIWGNLVRAQKPGKAPDESADLVPKTWELHCRKPCGETKVLASGVLAYDATPDGKILYTNGSAIFLLHPDGRREKMLNEGMIEQVFFLPD